VLRGGDGAVRDEKIDRDAAANGWMPCAGCADDYAPPGEDYCSKCFHAPFGPAWEQDQMDRMSGGGW